jgi:hypothetical protein
VISGGAPGFILNMTRHPFSTAVLTLIKSNTFMLKRSQIYSNSSVRTDYSNKAYRQI